MKKIIDLIDILLIFILGFTFLIVPENISYFSLRLLGLFWIFEGFVEIFKKWKKLN